MNRKNGFWLFVTSCLSGCGQMYQGYMKRGLSLLLAFFVLLAVAGFLGLAPVAFSLPVVWAYAFFDSYNLRTQLAEGTAQPDEYLFGLSDMDSRRMTELLRKRHSLVGWVLVVLGVYMLWDAFMRRLMKVVLDIPGLDWAYGLVIYDLPRLVLTAGIIALGVWFIRGPQAGAADEIPAFTPPTEHAPAGDAGAAGGSAEISAKEPENGGEADHGDD